MYVAKIPNRNSPPTYLIRESYRQNGQVKNRTVANITQLPIDQIRLISRVLKGERLIPADDHFRILRSQPHGHVQAGLRRLAAQQHGHDLARPELPVAEGDEHVAALEVVRRVQGDDPVRSELARVLPGQLLGGAVVHLVNWIADSALFRKGPSRQ